MEFYEINMDTLFLKGVVNALGEVSTLIIENDKEFGLKISPTEVIKYSCEFFGTTLEGRQKGSMNLLGIKHKVPIVVESSMELIFFPLCSPKIRECSWVCYNNIINYKRSASGTDIIFRNGKKITVDVSYGMFENQYMRATRLKMINTVRKLAK